MEDMPDYDIPELVLAAVFVGGSLISLIWAGAGVYHGELSVALRGSGLALVFLGGMAHPKKYILDCISFPVTLVTERSGRETPVTVVAGWLGLALSGAGLVLSQFD